MQEKSGGKIKGQDPNGHFDVTAYVKGHFCEKKPYRLGGGALLLLVKVGNDDGSKITSQNPDASPGPIQLRDQPKGFIALIHRAYTVAENDCHTPSK